MVITDCRRATRQHVRRGLKHFTTSHSTPTTSVRLLRGDHSVTSTIRCLTLFFCFFSIFSTFLPRGPPTAAQMARPAVFAMALICWLNAQPGGVLGQGNCTLYFYYQCIHILIFTYLYYVGIVCVFVGAHVIRVRPPSALNLSIRSRRLKVTRYFLWLLLYLSPYFFLGFI